MQNYPQNKQRPQFGYLPPKQSGIWYILSNIAIILIISAVLFLVAMRTLQYIPIY